MKQPRILLVEDDHSFGYILSEYLGMQDFVVDWVKSAEEAEEKLHTHAYDLAILDVMLPGSNGFELGASLRQRFAELPFLYLSAKSLKIDQLKGFRVGAVDYLTKPIDEELLVAKIRALLRQQVRQQPVDAYAIGSYEFRPRQFLL
ncbi:MAG: response regulator, partial [Bacteroidota bacterium]